MAYAPPKKKKSIWDTLGDVARGIGEGIDRFIPGDQSFLHGGGGQPTPPPRTSAPAVVNQIDRAVGFDRAPDVPAPYKPPAPKFTPPAVDQARDAQLNASQLTKRPTVGSVLREAAETAAKQSPVGQAIQQMQNVGKSLGKVPIPGVDADGRPGGENMTFGEFGQSLKDNVVVPTLQDTARAPLRLYVGGKGLVTGDDNPEMELSPGMKKILGDQPVKGSFQTGMETVSNYTDNPYLTVGGGALQTAFDVLDATGFGKLITTPIKKGIQAAGKQALEKGVISKADDLARQEADDVGEIVATPNTPVPKPATGEAATQTAEAALESQADNKPIRVNTEISSDLAQGDNLDFTIKDEDGSRLKLGGDTNDILEVDRVQKYINDIVEGRAIDPLVVQRIGEDVFVQDGKHRLAAMRALGINDVPTIERLAKGGVSEASKTADDVGGAAGTVARSEVTPAQAVREAAPDALGNQVHRSKDGQIALITNGDEVVYRNPDVEPATPVMVREPNPAELPGEASAPNRVVMPKEAKPRAATEDEVVLAENYKVKPETVTKLVDTYGAPHAKAVLDRTTEASNVRNLDAFAVAEARKQFEAVNKAPRQVEITGQRILDDAAQRAVDEEKRYKQGVFSRTRKGAQREGFDPYADLQRWDNIEAAAQGRKIDELDPAQTLTYLKGRAQNTKNEVEGLLREKMPTGRSIADLIQKYGAGTPAEKEFMSYANMRFDFEYRLKHNGRRIQPQYTDDQVAMAIIEYEAKNPDAATDAQTFKAFGDRVLDYGVEHGVITRQAAEDVKAAYDNYVPLERITPEDLPQINIQGGIRNSVARQNFIRNLTGESNRPLATTFSSVTDRANAAVKQGRTNDFDLEILRRAQAGTLGDSRIVVDPEMVATKSRLQELHKELVNSIKKGKVEIQKARTGARIQQTKLDARENDMVRAAREELIRTVDDPDAQAAIASMTKQDLLETYDGLLSGSGRFDQMARGYFKNRASLNKFKQTMEATRQRLDELDSLRRDTLTQKAGIDINPTTGLATIKGQQNGEMFAVEIPIDLAQGLSRLSGGGASNLVASIAQIPANIFKTLYTGAGAPIFTVINALVKNPALMFVNAKGVTPWGARAVRDGLLSVFGNSKTQRMLVEHGYNKVNATMSVADQKVLAEVMASRGGVKQYLNFMKNHPGMAAKDVFNQLNRLGAVLDNMQRTQVGSGLYYSLRRQGVPEEEAWRRAAVAANEVMGNFQRVSDAARTAEPFILYSGATQAGARALAHSFKARPLESITKAGALVTGASIATSSALSMDEGQAYFKDMVDSGKQYVLDGNLIFVVPGAYKDEKTGEWHGVYKLPIAPDFRPANRSVWQTLYGLETGEGANPLLAARAVFDSMTGDIRNSIVDPQTGFLGSNPVVQTFKTAIGVNPRTNEQLVDEAMGRKPKDEQVYSTTSDAAKSLAPMFGLSPIQMDQVLNSAGFLGQAAKGKGDPVVALEKQFQGGFGKSDSGEFFGDIDEIGKTIKNDDDFRAFQALHAKKNEEDKTPDKQAERYKILLARPGVLAAEAELDKRNREKGKPGNPLFDLSKEQQEKVLRYRAAKDLNAAKQAYAKDGTPLFVALGLDEKWYNDFRDAESNFYKAVLSKKDDSESNYLTYSGATKPEASDALQAKLDQYYTLPKGTGARSQFLRANPDILDYWAQESQFTNAERVAMGMEPLSDDGSSGGSGGYSRGGGGSRTASIEPGDFGSAKSAPKSEVKTVAKKVTIQKNKPKKVTIKRQKIV